MDTAVESRSRQLDQRLRQLLPGGVNSPVRDLSAVGGEPLIAVRGDGDTFWDVDGRQYIDYCCSWGALIHGHAHPAIVSAIQVAASDGTSFGITTPAEEILARRVVRLCPSIEKIRFVCSGTEATMSALRLARGYTGKEVIVKFSGNYHGHADYLLVQAGSGVMGLNASSSSAGVSAKGVEDTICLPYNDIEACRAFFQQPGLERRLAAVILEPIAGNMGVVPASPDFLQMLREQTSRLNALLIIDEVITGFRVALRGAQQLYGVQADLTALGKVVAGGMPAAAFGGRAEIMDMLAPMGPVYQAGTLAGNPLAMVAGDVALEMLEAPGTYEELARKTRIIVDPVQHEIAKRELDACIQHQGSMFTLFFGRRSVHNGEEAQLVDKERFGKFFRFMRERGIYLSPSSNEACFVSTVHSDTHLEKTAEAMVEFLRKLD